MSEYLLALFSILMLIIVYIYFVTPNLKLLQKSYYLRKHGVLYQAKIIDYLKESDSDEVTFYFPLVQFTTKSGKLVEGKLSIGKPKYDLQKRDLILIYSDVNNPENFIEKSFEPLVLGWIALIISIIGCILTLSFLWVNIKRIL